MMAMLKAVTKGLQITSKPGADPRAVPGKEVILGTGEHARVVEDKDGIEVIEVDEQSAVASKTDLSGVKSKLRPNDKVTVQYPDGKIAYGMKWKKVKEEVEAGKAKVL